MTNILQKAKIRFIRDETRKMDVFVIEILKVRRCYAGNCGRELVACICCMCIWKECNVYAYAHSISSPQMIISIYSFSFVTFYRCLSLSFFSSFSVRCIIFVSNVFFPLLQRITWNSRLFFKFPTVSRRVYCNSSSVVEEILQHK
jgi:hypothetical protein